MTVSELITEVRTLLTDTEEPYLWDDSELLSYVRDTINFAINYTGYGKAYSITLSTTQNVRTYPLSSIVYNVTLDNSPLIYVPYSTFDSQYGTSTDTGSPSVYSISNGTLYLYPTPDTIYNMTLTLFPEFTTITYDTIIPFPNVEAIKYGAVSRAYTKQDSETFNGEAIARFDSQFMALLNMTKIIFVRDYNHSAMPLIHGGLL